MTLRAPSRLVALTVLTGLLGALLVLGSPAALAAQTVTDPRIAEFDPSADHDAMLVDGQPAVSRYELELFNLGAQEPFHSVDMGKPHPDADGKIRFDFTGQVSAWPLPGGDYEARVLVVGPEGSSTSAPSNPFNFSGEQLQITAVTVSQAAVQPGTAVTWTASTAGGTGPIQFQFYRSKDGGSWIEAQAWSTSPTHTWTPGSTDVGTQIVQVWARNAESTAPYDAWKDGDAVSVYALPVVESLTPDRTAPYAVGTPITWTATTSGGIGPLQYQFFRMKDGGSWALVQAWSTSNRCTWTPAASDTGTHVIQVWVRNAASTATYDAAFNSNEVVVTAPVVIMAVSIDRSSPVAVGATVTWTAQTAGGVGPLQFQFLRSLNGGPWILAQAWSTSNALTWTPTARDTGTHVVQAQVRNAGSTAPYDASLSSAPLKVAKGSLKPPGKR